MIFIKNAISVVHRNSKCIMLNPDSALCLIQSDMVWIYKYIQYCTLCYTVIPKQWLF